MLVNVQHASGCRGWPVAGAGGSAFTSGRWLDKSLKRCVSPCRPPARRVRRVTRSAPPGTQRFFGVRLMCSNKNLSGAHSLIRVVLLAILLLPVLPLFARDNVRYHG